MTGRSWRAGDCENPQTYRTHPKGLRIAISLVLALGGVLGLDALLFRTRWYVSVIEPESTTGIFERILYTEQQAQTANGDNLVLTLGDSRFAYYPRVASRQPTGLVFRQAGVAGTDVRAWYYMLRDLDPTRRRYRAIVLGVDDYDDEDGVYDIGDDLATLHYVAARLRWIDVLDFPRLFDDPTARWKAFRGSLFKGTVFQRDFTEFLNNPRKRIRWARFVRQNYERWAHDFVESRKNVAGLQIDWNNLTAIVPPGNEALREQLDQFVLYKPRPQTGKRAAFRRRWFGRLLDCYRDSPTRIVFVRLPRGPIPRPEGMVEKKGSSIREFASRPRTLLANEHLFDALETPELFKDAFHLNDAGCERLFVLLAREVGRLLRETGAL